MKLAPALSLSVAAVLALSAAAPALAQAVKPVPQVNQIRRAHV